MSQEIDTDLTVTMQDGKLKLRISVQKYLSILMVFFVKSERRGSEISQVDRLLMDFTTVFPILANLVCTRKIL